MSEQGTTKDQVSKPGYNVTGETTIARTAAGEWVYWDWYWRDELERVAKETGCHVVLKSKQTNLSYGGVVPAAWNGQRKEVFV